ncbi:hypothetical protein QYM36_003241 [Artemia franciscana]|uniref:Uncharacterized protein n=1 Tax=Artemia franciscana TaxID=6661 RepID=A0AA88IJQ2_ARTSF|nr:hypothetical protein QYM36_003241 [Artemia franciscana]
MLLLAKEPKRYKVTIAGIIETHLTGSGEKDIGEGWTLLWSSGTQRRGGAGLILNSFTRKALLSFIPISSRLLRARIDGKHWKITFLICYVPTNEAEDEDKDDFYVGLSSELSVVPLHDYLIILGGFNAGVANSSSLYDADVVPVTADALNDNGQRLLNCCITYALSAKNTWFVKRDIAKHTLHSNDGKTKRYLTVRRHWLSSVQNCHS